MNTSQRTPRASHAFTCIEFLVIVAMIVALFMMRIAAWSRASARAQVLQDLSNFKSIMTAMHMYTADNRDYLPRPGWGTSLDCWAAGSGTFSAPGSSDNYPSVLSQQLNYVRRGQLWPYLKDYRLLICPADGPDKDPTFYLRSIVVSSYVWNGAIAGYSSSPVAAKITSPTLKSDAVVQWDMYSVQPYAMNDFSSYPSEGISARHGKAAPIGMFGGGAELIPCARWYQPNPADNRGAYDSFACNGFLGGSANNTAPNRAWCNPGSPAGH